MGVSSHSYQDFKLGNKPEECYGDDICLTSHDTLFFFFVMLANVMLITLTDIVLIVQAPSTVRWPFICSIDHARKK